MLAFIAALKHPYNSSNYELVESHLKNTLTSVCNQTDKNFKVVIVCNQIPTWSEKFEQVEFVKIEMSPISNLNTNEVGLELGHLDKGLKLMIAIKEVQKYNPSHLMVFDADDFISNKISAYVNANSRHKGWFIFFGYVNDLLKGKVVPVSDFNNCCGTSVIFNNAEFLRRRKGKSVYQRYVKFSLSKNYVIFMAKYLLRLIGRILSINQEFYKKWHMVEVDRDKSNFMEIIQKAEKYDDQLRMELFKNVDIEFIRNIIGNHQFLWSYYQLKPLPFRAAIWNINNGENMFANDQSIKKLDMDNNSIDSEFFQKSLLTKSNIASN